LTHQSVRFEETNVDHQVLKNENILKFVHEVHAASSETVRLSYQELIKESVGGKKMKVSDLVKKLTDIAKFNEADYHLNTQQAGGGSRKNKQLCLTVRR
jgi:hypothetical protein